MKVIINIFPLRSQHKTRGIGIYTRNLVQAIRSVDKQNSYIMTTRSQEIKAADVIHYPYFDLYFHTLPIFKKAKTVVTIHDIIPLLFPKEFPPGIRGRLNFYLQQLALKSVDAVITDSNNSKKDIVKFLRLTEKKVKVVYLAADSAFQRQDEKTIKAVKKKFKLPQNFALYVGDVNANKNLLRLVDAFKIFLKSYENFYLVLVGKSFSNSHIPQVIELKRKIENLNFQDKVLFVSNIRFDSIRELAAIYSSASFYIQPSLYEGFGLPLLEAMACETPVVASKTSSIPEVVADAAVMVDPYSIESIAQGMRNIASKSNSDRKVLIDKGIRRLRGFSWEKTAKQTIEVYRQVLA